MTITKLLVLILTVVWGVALLSLLLGFHPDTLTIVMISVLTVVLVALRLILWWKTERQERKTDK